MDIYAVPPRLQDSAPFLEAFDQTVRLAETYGLRGLLLFEGADVPFSPWVLAQHLLARSATLVPLVAVSPAQVSAASAARVITNLHRLYGRPLDVNLVAGAAGGSGSHAERYEELRRFVDDLGTHLTRVDAGPSDGPDGTAGPGADPVTRWFVAGHSDPAVELADRIGASNLRMLAATLTENLPARCALNFGLVTRPTNEAAWTDARMLFPERPGAARVAQRVASLTDSTWKAELFSEAPAAPGYWRLPAHTLRADAPFYIGCYDEVARLFADCREADVSAVLLDLPPSDREYAHLDRALQRSFELDGEHAPSTA
jgi:hypothetical protein